MASLEPSYLTTASPGYPNTAETQEDDLKFKLIRMIEAVEEEMNKPLKKHRRKDEYSSMAGGIADWYNHSGNQSGRSSENWK